MSPRHEPSGGTSPPTSPAPQARGRRRPAATAPRHGSERRMTPRGPCTARRACERLLPADGAEGLLHHRGSQLATRSATCLAFEQGGPPPSVDAPRGRCPLLPVSGSPRRRGCGGSTGCRLPPRRDHLVATRKGPPRGPRGRSGGHDRRPWWPRQQRDLVRATLTPARGPQRARCWRSRGLRFGPWRPSQRHAPGVIVQLVRFQALLVLLFCR